MEAASRADYESDPACRKAVLEIGDLPGPDDDIDDVLISWHTGFISGFPEINLRRQRQDSRLHCDLVQRRRDRGRDCLRPFIRGTRPTKRNDCRLVPFAGNDPCMGLFTSPAADCRSSIHYAGWCARGLGSDSGASERVIP